MGSLPSDLPAAELAEPQRRRVRFSYPDPLPTVWTPRFPEMSAAANAVSLSMPHVEPYVVASIRAGAAALPHDDPLRGSVDGFVAQEQEHHRQHHRFNELLVAQVRGLRRVEDAMSRVYGWLRRTRSTRFGVAFAAASESLAFSLARWTEAHSRRLFDGGDPHVSTLFLWHLAEEVEHKSVAHRVWAETDGSRRRYLWAALVSVVLLCGFTCWGSIVLLHHQRRLHHPVAWWRLAVWGTSLAFEVLPNLVAGSSRRHSPDELVDPPLLSSWLRHYDPATATMPLWWTGSATQAEISARSDRVS
jgi:predicted metal-dependent hydrolase